MKDSVYNTGFINGKEESVEKIFEKIDKSGFVIYEVIRIIDRIPLFFNEHIDRMREGMKLSGIFTEPDRTQILKMISILTDKSGLKNNNIKIIHMQDETIMTAGYFSKSIYPSADRYSEGYKTILIPEKRKNPNVKKLNQSLRDETEKIIRDADVDEAIYFSKEKGVLEGTKSNLLFVKSGKVFSTEGKNVLHGITRKKVMEICVRNHIEMEIRNIKMEELSEFEGAFLTGTSLKIMPVKNIGSNVYSSSDNPLIRTIMEEYENEIDKNLSENRNIFNKKE